MGSEERAKLRTLLNYWVEHNREHSQELREWADKAKAFGEVEKYLDVFAANKEEWAKEGGYRHKLLAAIVASKYMAERHRAGKTEFTKKYAQLARQYRREETAVARKMNW